MIAQDFVVPKFVKVDEGASGFFARFNIEPFERGYGTTVGNSLRRVLLASLEGSAVTALRIEGIQHEFSGAPGAQEDVTDVVLNFKKCQVRLNRSEPLIFTFKWSGEGELTAKEVFAEQDIEVYTPDQVILTSTGEDTEVEMEIKVSRGRGFVTAEEFELEHAPIGTIYLDASFSPVTRVNFQVEDARVGQTTDYDRLILDVWTNGSITPEDAVEEAARLLIDHLRIFVQQDDEAEGGGQARDEDPELTRKLSRPIEELELSVRAANCLKAANIETIGDLVVLEEGDLLQFHNFGRKSLEEIKDVLETYDLSLGMDVAPPPAAVAAAAPAPAEETEEAGEPSGEEE